MSTPTTKIVWPTSLYHSPTSTFCTGLCCSGFYRVEKLSGFGPPTLTNEIPPIFAKSNWEEKNDFQALDQPMRLASLLLDASLPFWYNLLFAPVRLLDNQDGQEGKRYELSDEVTELNPRQVAETTQKLTELTGHIKFNFTGENGSQTVSVGGRMKAHPFFTGWKSEIQIDGDIHSDLTQHWTGEWADVHFVLFYWDSFRLPATALHERAHAVLNARRPECVVAKTWLVLKGRDVSEEGYEWEAWTFGGLLNTVMRPVHSNGTISQGTPYECNGWSGDLVNMIVLEQWPNRGKVEKYLENRWHMGTRGSLQLPEVWMKWNVPFSFLHKLFQKSFWEDEYQQRGVEALKPQLMTGFRFCSGDGKGTEKHFIAAGTLGVPSGYHVAKRGLVIPAGTAVGDFLDSDD